MEEEKRKRGRPRKYPVEEDKPKRPRGRPKKTETEIPPQEAEQEKPKRKLQHGKHGVLPAHEIQTDEEMDAHQLEVITGNELYRTSKLYSRDVDAGEKIGLIVGNTREMLLDASLAALDPGKKIRLADTSQMIRTLDRYLKSCERIGAIPNKSGFAVACGCGRDAFVKFTQRHPEHPTTKFLEVVFESFADINVQAGQSGSCHPIFAMFILKSLYKMRENDKVEEPIESPLGEITDTEELMKKYADILPSYEEDEKD